MPRPTPPAEGDLHAPVLVSLSLDPVDVVTIGGAQSITVTARITDDWSGVNYMSISFEPDVGSDQQISAGLGGRISGDQWDGVYQSWMTVPQYSAGGRWHLEYVQLYDNVGNSQLLLLPSTSTLIMNQFWNNYRTQSRHTRHPQHLYVPVVGR